MSSYVNAMGAYMADLQKIGKEKQRHPDEEEYLVVCIEKIEGNKQRYVSKAAISAIIVAICALGSYYFGTDFIEIMKSDETLTAKILMALGIDITVFSACVQQALNSLKTLFKARYYIQFANNGIEEYKDKLENQQQGR